MVRELNPIPSQGYHTGETSQTVIPDAEVTRVDGGFHTVYNRRSLPTLTLNREYVSLLSQTEDPDTKDYLRSHLNDARLLVKSVEKRETTLTRIISELVRRQPQFFEDGQTILPMTLEDIASRLDLNISTISRAVQGKYLKCAAGTVEVKSLFVSGLRQQDGGAVSAAMVKKMLRDFVKAEDPAKPLSDEGLKNSFTLAKIDISRRTIAKYREELGIPSSFARRRR